MSDFQFLLEHKIREMNFFIRGKIDYSIVNKAQRFSLEGMPSGKKDFFVILHGEAFAATFGDWHCREGWTRFYNPQYKRPEWKEYVGKRREEASTVKKERVNENDAIGHARKYFDRLSEDCFRHPYVMKKRIYPYMARLDGKWLVVPVYTVDSSFRTVQKIGVTKKLFWKGISPKGLVIPIGIVRYPEIIYICEGYATGCTIHEAMGEPVYCALSASNLSVVATSLYRKFPDAKIILCADNDQFSLKNTGLENAEKAAYSCNGYLVMPEFPENALKSLPTDFNDLLRLSGISEVERQISNFRKIGG